MQWLCMRAYPWEFTYIVKRHQRAPKECVLASKFGIHVDVEAMVNQHELRLAVGLAANENIARMRIAVHSAP